MEIEINQHQSFLSEMRFVCKAIISKGADTRWGMRYIRIEADHIVATDGHRLHVLYCEHSFEQGYYEVIKNTKTKLILVKAENEISFPKWQDIVPHHSHSFELMSGVSYMERFTEKAIGCLAIKGIALRLEYFKPFIEMDKDWKIFYGDPDRPVRFIAYDKKRWGGKASRLEAIIMPFCAGYEKIEYISKSYRRKHVSQEISPDRVWRL